MDPEHDGLAGDRIEQPPLVRGVTAKMSGIRTLAVRIPDAMAMAVVRWRRTTPLYPNRESPKKVILPKLSGTEQHRQPRDQIVLKEPERPPGRVESA